MPQRPSRRVVLIAVPGAQSLDVTGPLEAFAGANQQLPGPAYRLVVASPGGGTIAASSGLAFATVRLATVRATARDTVLVAGADERGVRAAIADRGLTAWLARAAPVVERIGSVCSGAFALAAAGLLAGRRVATHWAACDRLAGYCATATVDREAIFVRDGRLWTSAGVTTGIDMALAMVEADHGRAVADRVASQLVLYARRPGFQSQWSDALLAQTDDDPLAPTIAWARAHLRGLDVPRLARQAGLSVRTLHRRCAATVGTTPAKLIERLRVEHARALLAAGPRPAKQVAAASGFADGAQLARAFRRTLGVTPRAYRVMFSDA
ncbi:MAG: helix-turn-helix domain-containing protein [Myxococcales bacterium]|nr:helix-turn-helix domain-containing protein [Myxococcales bacterium]